MRFDKISLQTAPPAFSFSSFAIKCDKTQNSTKGKRIVIKRAGLMPASLFCAYASPTHDFLSLLFTTLAAFNIWFRKIFFPISKSSPPREQILYSSYLIIKHLFLARLLVLFQTRLQEMSSRSNCRSLFSTFSYSGKVCDGARSETTENLFPAITS